MKVDRSDEGVVVHMPAHFYHASSGEFLGAIRGEIDSGTSRIIIDLKDTALIDSSAIGALVSIAKECKTRAVTLFLRHLHGDVSDLFIDTGLDKIFNIESGGGMRHAEVDIFEKGIDIRLAIAAEIAGDVSIFHMNGVMNHPQGSRYFKQQFLLAMAQLGMHPEHVVPGVDFSTGSLGHGLSMAVGAALAARMQNSSRRVYCLISDAECNEGAVWEAAAFAGHHRLNQVTAIVDPNGQQAFGLTSEVLDQS